MLTETEKLEQKLSFLKEQKAGLEAKIKGIEYSLSILRETSTPTANQLEEKGLTKSILHIIESEMTWWTPVDVTNRLKELGFNTSSFSNPNSFANAVTVTLKRLSDSERIKREEQDGKPLYSSLKFVEWV